MDVPTVGLRGPGDELHPLAAAANTECATCGEQQTATAATAIDIRPIQPTDALAYRSILERTSEEDRYCRFFHIVNHFDMREIKRFVDPREDTIGFIAHSGPIPLGVVHAFFISDSCAEVAIVVASDARQHGIGHALIERIVNELRARGCATACAVSLSTNGAFSHLAQSMGMTPAGAGETTNWTLRLAQR